MKMIVVYALIGQVQEEKCSFEKALAEKSES